MNYSDVCGATLRYSIEEYMPEVKFGNLITKKSNKAIHGSIKAR
jgi:hypothetical protein